MRVSLFEQFVEESYLAASRPPLYHSTSVHHAINVLLEDQLNGSTNFGGVESDDKLVGKGTSFTRDSKFVYEDFPVTFIVDWARLQNKTAPYDYYYRALTRKHNKNQDFEAEEMVFGPVKNLHKVLIGIRLNDGIEFFQNVKHDTKEQYRELYADFVDALNAYVGRHHVKVYRGGKEIDPIALKK